MSHPEDVLFAPPTLGLEDFANLASTCNGKIAGLSVQMVGQVGTARPTVNILYDGTSQLRSCQPNIDDLVKVIGPKRTGFGLISRFKTPGRSVAPLASINQWVEGANENVSLGGLPLASQYTVLIDKRRGENGKVDWTKLEDIRIKVNYVYSDVFPAGQCQ